VLWDVAATSSGRATLASSPAGRDAAAALALFVLRGTLPARTGGGVSGSGGAPRGGVGSGGLTGGVGGSGGSGTAGAATADTGGGAGASGAPVAPFLLPPEAWRAAVRALGALCADAVSIDAFRALPAAMEAVSRLERAGSAVAADAVALAAAAACTPIGAAGLAAMTSGVALAGAMRARVDGNSVAAAISLAPVLLELPYAPQLAASALTRALGTCLRRTALVLERPDAASVLGTPWASSADVGAFAAGLERTLLLHSWHRIVLARPALHGSAASTAIVVVPLPARDRGGSGSGGRDGGGDRVFGSGAFAAQLVYFIERGALLVEAARPPPTAAAADGEEAALAGGADTGAVRAAAAVVAAAAAAAAAGALRVCVCWCLCRRQRAVVCEALSSRMRRPRAPRADRTHCRRAAVVQRRARARATAPVRRNDDAAGRRCCG
jgi:hypothetical protein